MSSDYFNSPAVVVIIVAGIFAISALLISKFCSFFRAPSSIRRSTAYECGFEADKLHNFVSEKNHIISIYLLLELAFAWMLACAVLVIACSGCCTKHVIELIALLLCFLMILGSKYLTK